MYMPKLNYTLQDALSPPMYALTIFHLKALTTILAIFSYVGTLMFMQTLPLSFKTPHENHYIEAAWTISPILILFMLALPSLRILYLLDEVTRPILTIKTTGHQWYWSYDYADFPNLQFDSYMIPFDELQEGEHRMLEVDNRMVVPWGMEIRLLTTAADVIHSWAIPSLAAKADAVPGRLNQLILNPMQPSKAYGQCSEICGANHSFMPIAMESISMKDWLNWAQTHA